MVFFSYISTPFHLILQVRQNEKRSDARRVSAGLAPISVASECNNADGRLSFWLEGAAQKCQCGVAVLDKGKGHCLRTAPCLDVFGQL